MRDIRLDLRERLEEISVERERLEKRLAELMQKEDGVKRLFDEEDKRWGTQPPLDLFALKAANGRKHTPLGNFILEALSDDNIWTTEQVAQAALEQGLLRGSRHPNKAAHAALAGMTKNGYVEWVSTKHWRRSDKTKTERRD